MKQLKKNPSRLHPFDQQDRDYFETNRPKTFDDHIEGIETQLHMIKIMSKVVEDCKKTRGEVVLSGDSSSNFARLSRIGVRDLKMCINQFKEHLEQIEMTGEWK